MKKRNWIILIIAIVIILTLLVVVFWKYHDKNENNIYFQDKTTIIASEDVLSKQKDRDNEIRTYLEDKSYTLDNPKVLQNPYYIAPLTALVIFITSDEEEIEVYVNNILLTTYEKSKKHSIAIYGLKVNFKNEVLLKTKSGKEKTLYFQTEEYKGQVFQTEIKNTLTKDNFYFISAPMGLGISAIDAEGTLVWYLTETYNQDIEFLQNGHILVSNAESSGNEFGFTGFVEVDYLGKIYHNYVLENTYHHEVNELKDGNLMVLGDSNLKDVSQAFIYTIDRNSAKVLNSLNMFEFLYSIDSNVTENLRGKDFIINSIDYHEDTDEMILSLRGLNTVMSIQYKDKKINWIFGSDEIWQGNFKPYLLTVSSNTRYPLGQHTAFLTADGYLGIFNNDFDMYHTVTDTSLNNFKNNYSSGTLYQISNHSIKALYEYTSEDRSFNYALGSFNYTKDNHKLVNFGWNFKKEAFEQNLNLYDYFGYTYSRILEFNENNEEVFNATIDQSIYRAFKNSFYKDSTSNYQVVDYSLISNIPYNELKEIDNDTLKEMLVNVDDSNYEYTISKNSVVINAIFDDLNDVSFIFVGKDKNYLFNYKPARESAQKVIHLNLTGQYAVYLKIDDKIYDDGKIIDFS